MRGQTGTIVILCLCLGITSGCRSEHQALGTVPDRTRFEVPANQPFTETGFHLTPDTDYRFRHVEGRVCYQGADRCAPPRGSDVPGDEAWALHLKLGDKLIPYRDGMIVSVDEETELVFYLPEGDTEVYDDDKLPLYGDNQGAYRIEVEVHPTPQDATFRAGVVISPESANGWCEPAVDATMKHLAELGTRQVLLPIPHLTDGRTIWPGPRTPRVLCLVRATEAAREQGLSVGWSVEVNPADRSPRADLDPPDRDAFLAAYAELARVFAGLAQAEGVDLLSAGGGFAALTRSPEDQARWLSLFLDLHTRFFGTLFYTADRTELDQLEPSFWTTCCDRVGVMPDYSLSDATLPTIQQLVAAWKPHIATLRKTFKDTGLRLVLVGSPAYAATTRCAYRPLDAVPGRTPDEICQMEAYKAWFQVFGPESGAFASDHFLSAVSVSDATLPLSPLSRLAEEILINAWK